MKHLLFALVLFAATTVQAQSDKYADAMKKNLEMFDADSTSAHWENLAAAFQRIGDAEKTQWLPYYWERPFFKHDGLGRIRRQTKMRWLQEYWTWQIKLKPWQQQMKTKVKYMYCAIWLTHKKCWLTRRNAG